MNSNEKFLSDCARIELAISFGKEAIAEASRLKALNEALLAALRPIAEHGEISANIIQDARAAIAKAVQS